MADDPYAALGVAKTATQDEIRKAYKKIAKKSHPDLNPGDAKAAERFKAAAAAHDLLKDPEKRARFDRGEIDASGQERPERKFYREYAEGPEATYHTRRGFEDFGDMRTSSPTCSAAGRAGPARRRECRCAGRTGTIRWRWSSSRRRGRHAADHPAGRPGARREDFRRASPKGRRSGCAARAARGWAAARPVTRW